ncbi:glycosyl transferase family 8 [Streptococcus hongkongensis]
MIIIDTDGKNLSVLKETLSDDFKKIKRTIILSDNGFLEDETESLMMLIAGIDHHQKQASIYYNRLKLPDFWEVTLEGGLQGRITFWGQKKAIIDFSDPIENRMVHTITWLTDTGDISYKETYNQFGFLYSKEYYEDNQALATFYYDKEGKEFAQTIPGGKGIIIGDQSQLAGFYPSRLSLLRTYLQLEGNSDKVITVDDSLLSDSEEQMDFLNCGEGKRFDYLINEENKLGKIIDFSHTSQAQSESYVKVFSPQTNTRIDKSLFILSASDCLEMIDQLILHLPDYHFRIGARTEVSDKFLGLGRYDNVTVFAEMTQEEVEKNLEQTHVYLDVNHLYEVDHIISRAILKDIPILSFKVTAHHPHYYYPGSIFESHQMHELITYIKSVTSNKELSDMISAFQKSQIPFCYVSKDKAVAYLGDSNDDI